MQSFTCVYIRAITKVMILFDEL